MNDYTLSLPISDPYSALIRPFIIADYATNVKLNSAELLDCLTDAIVATNQVRFGPKPNPESLVEIRKVISLYTNLNQPIPFMVPWGSEKSNGSGVDMAELSALKTLSCLQSRVTKVYAPGVQLNIRLEDVSAPHLFYERMEEARQEAALYTGGFINLVQILGLSFVRPVLESSLITEERFNQMADEILFLMGPHLTGEVEAGERLVTCYGWKPLSAESLQFYVERNRAIYPNAPQEEIMHRVARYFAGALARKVLGMKATDPSWGNNYLELSFISSPGNFPRRVYYRTMPSSITSAHMPPWRSKGILRIENDTVSSTLVNFKNNLALNPYSFELQKGETKQTIRADYQVL